MEITNITLGEGTVAIVKQIKIGENMFAIKQFKKKYGRKEYIIHSQLNHPNIVKFIVGNEKFIVTELMMPYDLFEFVKIAGQISVNASNCILKQLVGALKYMHEEKRIIHRDIKLENVLVDEITYQVKICDFNVSQSLDEGKVTNIIGTEGYIAPEINYIGSIDALNLKECDIFSLGVLYFTLLFGKFPFKTTDKSCPYFKIIQQNKWDEFWYYTQKNIVKKVPPFCLELIQGMIQIDPKNRLSLDQILNNIENINEMEYINEMSSICTNLKRQR
ncbi:unnamed protein product [Paramecium primaurelia]|uniref:Protein kinase domain-containing protein n=1 Tax=Paramecium primaurelia TaxID=5886 RepID=A0A8S1PUU4_PARPR|nr:unnamed protein product [Paramecium primaurelia]